MTEPPGLNQKKTSPARIPLPVDRLLPDLVRALGPSGRSGAVVLQASPGTGKTTRVPPALLDALPGEILVLEPRRLAAKYAALRVAEERGEAIGLSVGYQFRFENVTSRDTRLTFLTEGMLMRKLLKDPRLEGVSAVVLDEFHERHLHGDVALGALRRLQLKGLRPDLKLVVMSATLETDALSRYLGDCPVLKVESPLHPVALEHLPAPASVPLERLVRDAVARALGSSEADSKGDILVFLPGMSEIRRAESALGELSAAREGRLRILPLHGEIAREEQDLALRPIPGKRKVILSTNVAETSLTIEGVTVVIDSGLHRQAAHSWWSGVPSLKTRPITRASAIQRAGRAGRTAPGRCIRLYTLHDFNGRAAFETPEIRRADIASTVLEVKVLGGSGRDSSNATNDGVDAAAFPWFEAPGAAALEAAQTLLHRLGFTASAAGDAALTALGRRGARIPAHPRMARLLIEAHTLEVLERAATLAALIYEGELEGLDALEQARRADQQSFGSFKRARSQLLSALARPSDSSPQPRARAGDGDAESRLARSVLAAFPDRIARKRPIPAHSSRGRATDVELILSSGGSARAEDCAALASHELFVALDIQETQAHGQARSQLRLKSVVPLEPEWLFDLEPTPLRETDELIWDSQKKRVLRSSRLLCDELVLSEDLTPVPPGLEPAQARAAARVLIRQALGLKPEDLAAVSPNDWSEALSHAVDSKALERFQETAARIALLARHAPELLPGSGAGGTEFGPVLSRALEELFSGKRSAEELASIDWAVELPAAAGLTDFSTLDRLLPAQFVFPNGRRAPIHYALDQAPWIESRMQDFFGLKAGPAVLQGRLPLTLHLLAPNHRAVQVTTDLPGFWQRTYPELRTQLSRRYPRHQWPESPLTLIKD